MRNTRIKRVLPGILAAAGLLSLGRSLAGVQTAVSPQIPLQKSPVNVAADVKYPVIMPYQSWQGLPIVLGTINDAKIPDRFVLATGLNACAITEAIYTRMALKASPRLVRVSILDTERAVNEAEMPRLQVGQTGSTGTVRLENVPAAMVNVFGVLSRSPRPDPPPCWLGAPFFAAFQVTFDFPHHVLILNPPKSPLPKEEGTQTVPIKVREGRIWVEAAVQGAKPFQALVDTGTFGTLLPSEVAMKLRLKPLQEFSIVRANGKETRAALAVVPKLRLGKAEGKDVRVVFVSQDSPSEFDRSRGVLGMDFLSQFKVTIDYDRQIMTLTPPDAPEEEAIPAP